MMFIPFSVFNANGLKCLLLLYALISKKEVRANVTKANGPVWEDSCVEFFVLFDKRGYYNFEFNCIGSVLAAFGSNRNDRKLLPQQVLKTIETNTKHIKKNDRFYWEMVIVIPAAVFIHHSLHSLKGMVCKAISINVATVCGNRIIYHGMLLNLSFPIFISPNSLVRSFLDNLY